MLCYCEKKVWERVPTSKKVSERRSYAFLSHYSPASDNNVSQNKSNATRVNEIRTRNNSFGGPAYARW